MEFQKVKISNFKKIEEMELNFMPGMNLLIGDNGVGKTSILEALTIVLSIFFNGITGVAKKGISASQVRIDTHVVGDASRSIRYCTPVIITSNYKIVDADFSGEVSRRDQTNGSKTRYIGKEITEYASSLVNNPQKQLPLLCYYSTQRLLPPKREDLSTGSKNKLNDRRCGYIGCLDENLDIKALKSWCLKMEMTAFQKEEKIKEYEAFKRMVSRTMVKMSDLDTEPGIAYSREFEDMVYMIEGVSIPINYLSAGYQSLLWMVMDMAFRLALLNPELEDFSEATGIVMIDEIDMHLHPKWQWKVVGALKETFPGIQFIIATHSPIIISSCKDANLIAIDSRQNVTYLEDAYAYSIYDVLEFRQGSDGIPQNLKTLYSLFDEALNNEDYEQAQRVLDNMETEYGENNSEVKRAKFELGMDELTK